MIRGLKFRIKEVERLYYLCSEKKALISCVVDVQLISAFVFAYAKSLFSHDVAQICYLTKISYRVMTLTLSRINRCLYDIP